MLYQTKDISLHNHSTLRKSTIKNSILEEKSSEKKKQKQMIKHYLRR